MYIYTNVEKYAILQLQATPIKWDGPGLIVNTYCWLHYGIPLLKNMYRTTADFLLILNGCPLSTILLHTTLLGSTL